MAKLLLIVKILPTGTEIDLDKLVEGIKSSLKDDIELRQTYKRTISFWIRIYQSRIHIRRCGR